MGWFSSDKKEEAPSTSTSFTDTASFGSSDHDFGDGGDVSLGAGGASDIQQFSVSLQQQLLVQQVISDLTDQSFDKCLTGTPKDNALSSYEVSCIHATVNKWMDTNEFMMGRMGKKAQAAQQQGGMQMH